MTFDPTNPDGWDPSISPKSTPQDSLRELFNSDSVEFEPIDDDEDSDLDIQVSDSLTNSGGENLGPDDLDEASSHPADQPTFELEINPPFVNEEAIVARDRNSDDRSSPKAPTRPPQPPKPPTAETKPQSGHWDLLAAQLGLAGSEPSGVDESQTKPTEENSATHVAQGFSELEEDDTDSDSPLRELFIPSGEVFEEATPRVIDDISVEIDEDYIEFEVEDLVPEARRPERPSKRDPRQRPARNRSSEERKPRRDEAERDSGNRRGDAQSKSDGEPATTEKRSERRERDVQPAKEKRSGRKEGAAVKERDSRRDERAQGKKKKPAQPAPIAQHDDDDDDFVEITDDSGSDKNITTWRQAISAIVETNIKNHESSSSQRSSGNRGKRPPRKDGGRKN